LQRVETEIGRKKGEEGEKGGGKTWQAGARIILCCHLFHFAGQGKHGNCRGVTSRCKGRGKKKTKGEGDCFNSQRLAILSNPHDPSNLRETGLKRRKGKRRKKGERKGERPIASVRKTFYVLLRHSFSTHGSLRGALRRGKERGRKGKGGKGGEKGRVGALRFLFTRCFSICTVRFWGEKGEAKGGGREKKKKEKERDA